MFCEKCGKTVPENSKFCPECGFKISSTENFDNDDSNKITRIIRHLVFTFFAILLWGCFVWNSYYFPYLRYFRIFWKPSMLVGGFLILLVSYNFTDSQISKRKERKKNKETYKKNYSTESGFKIARNIIIPILIIGFIGYGVYYAANRFMKENNLGISTRINSTDITPVKIVKTLYDDSFYVAAQSHVPIYFSTSGGNVNIKANTDRKVEFITMSKYEYENRVSLLLDPYHYYPNLSSEGTFMDSDSYLPSGDYVFIVQCVGLHIHERKVHVTIKETLY